MKQCVDCGDVKSDDEFYAYELTKNRGRCKVCLRNVLEIGPRIILSKICNR